MTRSRFAGTLALYLGLRLRNGVERAFLTDGRLRARRAARRPMEVAPGA